MAMIYLTLQSFILAFAVGWAVHSQSPMSWGAAAFVAIHAIYAAIRTADYYRGRDGR